MKKTILCVVLTGVLAITACTQKTEVTPVSHLAINTIFLPQLLVATAD